MFMRTFLSQGVKKPHISLESGRRTAASSKGNTQERTKGDVPPPTKRSVCPHCSMTRQMGQWWPPLHGWSASMARKSIAPRRESNKKSRQSRPRTSDRRLKPWGSTASPSPLLPGIFRRGRTGRYAACPASSGVSRAGVFPPASARRNGCGSGYRT